MPFLERFSGGQGIQLGVQLRTISGITNAEITGLRVDAANIDSEHHFVLEMTIDSQDYEIDGTFTDDTLNERTLRGYKKIRNPATNQVV